MENQNFKELEDQINSGGEFNHSISVDYESNNKERFKGNVVVKRPTMGDYLKIGAIKANYLKQSLGVDPVTRQPIYPDPVYIDDTIKMVAQMIATFKVVVIKAPKWFQEPEKINDFKLLDIIYMEYEEWLNNFRDKSSDEPERDSKKSRTKDQVVDS